MRSSSDNNRGVAFLRDNNNLAFRVEEDWIEEEISSRAYFFYWTQIKSEIIFVEKA